MIKIILISLALIFVIIGALISALAAIGLLRLEDVYSRAHAAGKASTLGAMSLLFGTFLYFIATQGFCKYAINRCDYLCINYRSSFKSYDYESSI